MEINPSRLYEMTQMTDCIVVSQNEESGWVLQTPILHEKRIPGSYLIGGEGPQIGLFCGSTEL